MIFKVQILKFGIGAQINFQKLKSSHLFNNFWNLNVWKLMNHLTVFEIQYLKITDDMWNISQDSSARVLKVAYC